MAHAYSNGCGCSSCCRFESAAEQDVLRALPFIGALKGCGLVLGEAISNADAPTLAALAAAMGDEDFIRLGELTRAAVDRYVAAALEDRMEECGCGLADAAEQLAIAFEVAPETAPVLERRAAG